MLLTTAAGCVNAVGYLALGGVFTSVMTANSALLGLALAGGYPAVAHLAALAIVAYLVGVALGSKAALGSRQRPPGMRGALVAEAVVLWAVWVFWLAVGGEPGSAQQATLLAGGSLAMGCQSGGVRIVTGGAQTTAYMTGAITGVVSELVANKQFQKHVALIVVLIPVGAALGGLAIRWARLAAPAIPALLVTAALVVVSRAAPPAKAA
ncbi:hypothetical protein GCM10010515_49910 [Streptomyces fructofermentans]|uniref:DUF1275 domain-containing protein n=2 Tax=Streptomyces fructofermentans TaxID=152141 RepID=A0A918NKR8_9ACTN|nr:hypothetical protein GCM10010515_49910 [Streptomyces fructofermentans]